MAIRTYRNKRNENKFIDVKITIDNVLEEYEDYMCNQPMRDGEEIRNFFDSLDDEEE